MTAHGEDGVANTRWNRIRAKTERIAGSTKSAATRLTKRGKRASVLTKEKTAEGTKRTWLTTRGLAKRGWERTTDVSEDAWEWTRQTSGRAWNWTTSVSGDGAEWMKTNAPAAWRRVHEGGSKAISNIAEHDDEIKAALSLIVDKTTRATEFIMQYDDEIMAATAVLAVFQPQLLVVAASYEAGKPAIKALTKLVNRYRDKQGSADLTKEDWKAISRLTDQLTKRQRPAPS